MLARLVVTAVLLEGRSKAEVARDYGVSWRWVHELCRRYEADGEAGLEPRSRRPRRSPNQISQEQEDAIVELRKELSDAGLDAGAHTICFHLERRGLEAPSVATIWRVLCRRGFVTPQPQKRPKSSYTRFCADLPNERWQADTTHVQAAGRDVEVLDVIDDHSRLLVASTCRSTFKAGDVVDDFHAATRAYGAPASLLTDNGAVFTGVPRGGFCALEVELAAAGIAMIHSRPYHPQTCGKVERFHQTLKKWLAKQPEAADLDELQAQLDRFRDYYNKARPHRAIGRRTPSEAFDARPKAVPSARALKVTDHRLRKDTIDRMGKLTIRHDSVLHHIGMGRRLAGTKVFMLIDGLHIRIVARETGELLRELTLDTGRNYQPQGEHGTMS